MRIKNETIRKILPVKNQAKDALGGKYGTAIWVAFLGTLIPGAIRMFANLLFSPLMPSAAGASTPGVQIPAFLFSAVVSLLLSILLGVFDVGIAYCFLKLACGQSCRIGDLFFGFQEDFKKFVTLSGTLAILNAICLFPYQYLLEEYLYTRNTQWLYLALGAMGSRLLHLHSVGAFPVHELFSGTGFPGKECRRYSPSGYAPDEGAEKTAFPDGTQLPSPDVPLRPDNLCGLYLADTLSVYDKGTVLLKPDAA